MAILTDRASFKGAILIEKTKAYPWASRNSIYLHMKTDYNTDIGKQRITWSYRKKKKMVQQSKDRSLKRSSLDNIQSYMPCLPKCGRLFSVFKFESSASVIRIFSDSLINHPVPLINIEQESMDSIILMTKLSLQSGIITPSSMAL